MRTEPLQTATKVQLLAAEKLVRLMGTVLK
jgi:hypothetical protein